MEIKSIKKCIQEIIKLIRGCNYRVNINKKIYCPGTSTNIAMDRAN